MKLSRPNTLASEDEARDDEILRRHGSHADDADAAPRERMALARTRLRDDGDGDERGSARHGRTDNKRASARRMTP